MPFSRRDCTLLVLSFLSGFAFHTSDTLFLTHQLTMKQREAYRK